MKVYKVYVYYFAISLIAIGILLIIPSILSVVYGEVGILLDFLITAICSVFVGSAIFLSLRFKPIHMRLNTAMACCALIWIVVSIIGSLPFFLSGRLGLLDSIFESFSGFTATGLTMCIPEELERSLLVWRSLLEWVGGAGMILLFLTIMSRRGGVISKLYMAEGRTDRLGSGS